MCSCPSPFTPDHARTHVHTPPYLTPLQDEKEAEPWASDEDSNVEREVPHHAAGNSSSNGGNNEVHHATAGIQELARVAGQIAASQRRPLLVADLRDATIKLRQQCHAAQLQLELPEEVEEQGREAPRTPDNSTGDTRAADLVAPHRPHMVGPAPASAVVMAAASIDSSGSSGSSSLASSSWRHSQTSPFSSPELQQAPVGADLHPSPAGDGRAALVRAARGSAALAERLARLGKPPGFEHVTPQPLMRQ